MRIAILSRARGCYSTRRLREACLARGHETKVLDTLRFSMAVEQGQPELYYKERRLSRYDAVIPRIGASITFYGTAVVRQFEQMGVFTLNGSHAITVARDKLRALQVLSRHNVGFPATTFVRHRDDLLPAIDRLGGGPVVVKMLEGTQGMGVILADSRRVAQTIVETLQSARQNVLIQRFVAESRGRDVRAFVVGGRVVAAMRRIAQGDEFRSNVHRGGRTETIQIDPDYERTAIRAAQIMGLRVAGVDMLESKDGPLVLEINSSPGLQGIEATTKIDVAGAIVEHIEEQVLFPEVDLKQRLTLDKGYGVSEFPITPGSELAGRTLAEAKLQERDVRVLSVQRGSLVIPNPRGTTRLYAGDVVLCFGKLIALKHLIPRDARRGPRGQEPSAPEA
ncbi:30S ribosomal protein S6--L-glutamate ligase [Sandaracinus amylolyticus]|uniref:Ribosomal protein S6 glutaminyl transferase n=1 Tax=Sandaracinus amylolyticus TaxID=927083 RepID=A0A0F6YKL1_9BACT|nr:30S ribosomal protein S6--L-glutamate ligase [Sandaracinus amylolyticus]AKF09282.1 Ribosomal protein S6 glutaminyl transferase [Sandaracinus amylolyticus]